MSRLRSLALIASLLVLLGACGAGTPEERIAGQRGRYTAKLNAFIVSETPVALEPPAEGEPSAGEPAEGEPAEEAFALEPEVRQDVELDLIVQHDANQPLPGITVDVSMAGPDGVEKGHWRIWVDTAGLPKANQKAVSHVLEDVDYEEGYGFYAEVRHPVPAAERAQYQEFAAAGG